IGAAFDPDTTNNTVIETTTVMRGEADLGVRKSDFPDPVVAGGDTVYTVTVTNFGPDPASDVFVRDRLPNDVDFVTATSPSATCTVTVTNLGPDTAPGVMVTDTLATPSVTFIRSSSNCNTADGTVISCNLGTMPPNTTASITITVVANVSGPITNTATVASGIA